MKSPRMSPGIMTPRSRWVWVTNWSRCCGTKKESFAQIYFKQHFFFRYLTYSFKYLHLQDAGVDRWIFWGMCHFGLVLPRSELDQPFSSRFLFFFFGWLVGFFLFFCRCLIAFRRSTRWWTVATAPLRGAWISAQLPNLWRGYDLTWMGRMKLMAGLSWMAISRKEDEIWYLQWNILRTHLYVFISSKSGGDSTLIQKLAEMSKSNLDHTLNSYFHICKAF